jgi:hypothetical protein
VKLAPLSTLICFCLLFFTNKTFSQNPIANNDTFTVTQFSTDTLNVTANDSSTTADSICITGVYGSPLFSYLNCNNIVFRGDSTYSGNDTCWYILCSGVGFTLCDTAMVVVNVAPTYTPFILNNAKWVIAYYSNPCVLEGIPPDIASYVSYITNDSITSLDGLNYYAIYETYSAAYYYDCDGRILSSSINNVPSLSGYLRQDTINRRVYLRYPGSASDSLIYDFNLTVGDSIAANGVGPVMTVTSISNFISGGNSYPQYNFSNSSFLLSGSWFQGFGSENGLFTQFNFQESGGPYLTCFSYNNQTIYPAYADSSCSNVILPTSINDIQPNLTHLYPNPATTEIIITGLQPQTTITITNLLGQVLMVTVADGETKTIDVSHLPAGMYFVNNMKMVKE